MVLRFYGTGLEQVRHRVRAGQIRVQCLVQRQRSTFMFYSFNMNINELWYINDLWYPVYMIYGFIIYWQSACSTSATRLNVFAKQRASFFNSACADTLFWLRLDTASAARWMPYLTRLRMSLLFWLLLCCDISSCDNGVGVSFIFIFDICDICVNGRPSCDVCGCDNGVGVSFIFIFDICDICFNGKPSCDVGCITSSQNLFSSCDENVCSCDNSLKSCDNVCSWENIISARRRFARRRFTGPFITRLRRCRKIRSNTTLFFANLLKRLSTLSRRLYLQACRLYADYDIMQICKNIMQMRII